MQIKSESEKELLIIAIRQYIKKNHKNIRNLEKRFGIDADTAVLEQALAIALDLLKRIKEEEIATVFLTAKRGCICEAQAPENWLDITGTNVEGNWFNMCPCGLNHKGHQHCNICGGLTATW